MAWQTIQIIRSWVSSKSHGFMTSDLIWSDPVTPL
jgi:hypothetical protein